MAASTSGSSSSDSEQEPVVSKRTRPAPKDDSSDSDTDPDSEAAPEPTEDAPVLSHAEQRKEKKRAAKAAAAGTDESKSPAKKRKLNDGKAEKTNPSQRKNSVWVGNMAFKTTADDLRSFFAGCGEITRMHMPTKPATRPGGGPENRGFAYVDFATEEAKALAIARSENPLTGRKLLIKDGKSFEGRPAVENAPGSNLPGTHTKTAQKILKQQKQPPAPTLFLGNLGFNTTEESIKELLNAHRTKPKSAKGAAEGEEAEAPDANWIRKVRMGTFEDSGLCKGFAFVDFSSIENSTSALVNSKNHKLDGRDLVVEYASADAVRRGASRALDGSKSDRPSFDSKRRERQSPRNIRKAKAAPATAGETEEAVTQETPPVAESAPPREDGRVFSKHGKTARRDTAGPKSRPRPGAALALAKRETAAIVPSQGNKITFD